MVRQLGRVAVCSILATALCGCGSARYVTLDANSGVVAIPTNVNSWPFDYRDQAEALMRKKCPQGYVIDHEEDVICGTTHTTNTNTEKKNDPVLAAFRVQAQTEEHVSQTTTSSDQHEWRIWFHGKEMNQ